MRILLTNDDGIRAPGMVALHDALIGHFPKAAPIGEVVTVAPLSTQSAAAHGITFRTPLMTAEVDVNERLRGLAVDGRPADCVKLALSEVWPTRFGKGALPDLCLSGTNMGANAGINVLYSGTVAAAIEAAFLGVPSIAFSLHLGKGKARYDVAAGYARAVLERILSAGLPPAHTCLSVNIPITEGEGGGGPLPPIRVAPMNTHGMIDTYQRNVNPAGETYYWSASQAHDFQATTPGSDVQLLFDRCITVTPLRYDMTDHGAMKMWGGRLEG